MSVDLCQRFYKLPSEYTEEEIEAIKKRDIETKKQLDDFFDEYYKNNPEQVDWTIEQIITEQLRAHCDKMAKEHDLIS